MIQITMKIIIKAQHSFLVFAFLIVLFYGNSLSNGFALDDTLIIPQNPYVQSLRYFPKIFTGCIWEATLGGCYGKTMVYRPLQTLSYLLTYQLSTQPWIFHLVNLLYFLIAVSLMYKLVKAITKTQSIAFLAAIFFLVHPINSEVVNWISSAPEILYTIFILCTILAYLHERRRPSAGLFSLILLLYFLAMLSKEFAVFVIPPLLLLIDLLVIRKPVRALLSRRELKRYALFAIPFFTYLLLRQIVLGGGGGLTSYPVYLGTFTFLDRNCFLIKLLGL